MDHVKQFQARRGTPLPACERGERFNLLAIDPGVSTGWAVFDKKLLRACGLHDPPIDHAARIVIEIPQVYPRQPVPPNDLIALAFMAGRYAGAVHAAVPSVEVTTVFPHQWKGNMPKDVCNARVLSRLSPEEYAVVDALDVPAKQLHNVLDAIGIGLFFEKRFR